MINTGKLEDKGWTLLTGIASRHQLLELAHESGQPLPHPGGEIIKEVRTRPAESARPGTLSSKFGTGTFPLHTDTAFFEVPARFILLRVLGDTRRATTVLPFRDVIYKFGEPPGEWAERSIWRIRSRTGSIYGSMCFDRQGIKGWRFDTGCMSPANLAAKRITEAIGAKATEQNVQKIDWSSGCVAVISNWTVLHGRGPAPDGEREGVLERIYVGAKT